MGGEGVIPRRLRPDVHVVHQGHPGQVLDPAAEPVDVDVFRSALAQHVDDVGQQAPGVHERQDGDQGRAREIRGLPSEHLDGQARQYRGRWTHDAREGALPGVCDAPVLSRGLFQHEHDGEMHRQPDHRDTQQETAVDVGYLAEPAPRLEQNPRRDRPQHERAGQRGEYLGALVAEGAPGGAGGRVRSGRQQRRSHRDAQGQAVSRVGQERQASGHDPAGHLCDGYGDDEGERNAQAGHGFGPVGEGKRVGRPRRQALSWLSGSPGTCRTRPRCWRSWP